MDASEECDDKNKTPGDGCGASCKIEAGYACKNAPNLNTGSDGLGGKALVGANDQIWSWSDKEGASGSPAKVAGDCAAGAWQPEPSNARWINRYGCGTTTPELSLTYYTATFEIATDEAAGLTVINGTVWADNEIKDVLVNGVSTGFTGSGFNGPGLNFGEWPSKLYKKGVNTLTVVVFNAAGKSGNPDGLLVTIPNAFGIGSVCAKTCGNSSTQVGETCDDGNDKDGDGCDKTCQIEAGYVCKGGPSQCHKPVCGDGTKEGDEACDDGNDKNGDGCSKACAIEKGAVCGNGKAENGEFCEDGNDKDGDGCSKTCTVEAGYVCDMQLLSCAKAVCGDGFLDHPAEICDDGNTKDGDGCSKDCLAECKDVCGNGKLSPGEICDDGNDKDGDGCSKACQVETGYFCFDFPSKCEKPKCGDNALTPPYEQCDDGNDKDGDGCSKDCKTENKGTCGDAKTDADELCDDGNTTDGDGCSKDCALEAAYVCAFPYTACVKAVCGDGKVQLQKTQGLAGAQEWCDDGNTTDGDGCSSSCQLENACAAAGGVCGDGFLDKGEACDDKNTADGDGCSKSCAVEAGFACKNAPNLNTGGDGKGGLAAVGSEDALWTWSATKGGAPNKAIVAGNCAVGAWTAPTPLATWINRLGCGQDTPGDTLTYYSATFDISDANTAANYTIAGTIWADNMVEDVLVNGVSTGFKGSDYKGDGLSFGAWPSALYKAGTNTITVVVYNAPKSGNLNPDGLLISIPGAFGGGSKCATKCGDGSTQDGETCDDGNTTDGDGCSNACAVEAGYVCKGGPSACVKPVCGDGKKEGSEECDDGNGKDGDGCSKDCKVEAASAVCGDNKLEVPEECDDGNKIDGDGCSKDCKVEAASAVCGDNKLEVPEECDDGNTTDGDGCSKDCKLEGPPKPSCGNKIPETGEWCDDGNNTSGDGCSDKCTVEKGYVCLPTNPFTITCSKPVCGNSDPEFPYETCDDGNTADGDGCDKNCKIECPQKCGDGTVVAGEWCDDGNNTDGDGCSKSCHYEAGWFCFGMKPSVCNKPVCGDGVADVPMEDCDDNNKSDGDGCSKDCKTEIPGMCGNGVEEPGEICDDGNATDGDGCSKSCKTEAGFACQLSPTACEKAVCGDGVVQIQFTQQVEGAKEWCDDGNTSDGDGCNKDCQIELFCGVTPTAVCGDGKKEGAEQCDDGNTADGDGCAKDCKTEAAAAVCGDGKKEGAEQCDDGNTADGDGCAKDCKTEAAAAVCGDGKKEGIEECDDGNKADGDGCAKDCKTEAAAAVCGDGKKEGIEECDDGNKADGDGCSKLCETEQTPEQRVTGGSCTAASGKSGTSGSGALVMLAALALLAFRSRPRRGILALVGALVAGGLAAPGSAQAAQVDVQAFQPSPFIFDLFTVGKGETEGPTRANVSLYFNYAKNPLVLREKPVGGEESITRSIVSDRLTGDLLGSFRVLPWFAVGLSVPVNVWQAGDGIQGVASPKAFSMGDLRVYPRVRLLGGQGSSFGLAFTPIVTLPTGGAMDIYSGRPGVSVQPTVHGHMAFGPAGVALTLGAAFGGEDGILDLKVGNELLAKLGAWYSVVPDKLDVIVEGYGKTALSSPFSDAAQSPFEVDLGVKWRPLPAAFVSAGVGTGLSLGYTAPDLRAFVGFTMAIPEGREVKEEPKAPPAPDTDKDGLPDAVDKCPTDPEDKDGFEDADGCPEPDDDQDGVCDGWVSERGAADKHASVCKGKDQCQTEPEDKDSFEDEDGCPEPDNDKDGVCDPWVAEKGLGAKFASACKGADKCVLVPEDKDAFEDEDGCPDPDDDKDGVCDAWIAEQGKSAEYAKVCKGADKCPDKKEKHNGLDDEDGCPDQVVQVTEKELVIMQSILFVFNKSVILKESYPVLDEVVEILKEHKRIKLISIEGHTDLHGKPGPNMKLSTGRVQAVMAYLAKAGIEKRRLTTKAWGMTKPKVKPERTPADAQQNRRVEFIILKQDAATPTPASP